MLTSFVITSGDICEGHEHSGHPGEQRQVVEGEPGFREERQVDDEQAVQERSKRVHENCEREIDG